MLAKIKHSIDFLSVLKVSCYFYKKYMLTGVFRQSHLILIVLGLSCFLLLTLILFSIYQQPIYIWDEAIYANNSLEMAQHHNYLVYTNNGVPDHYNSKPPMALWLQSISFQLFSFSEFALRLPTFLALIGIIALFYLTSKKLNENASWGR